jgi:hypothetical protein
MFHLDTSLSRNASLERDTETRSGYKQLQPTFGRGMGESADGIVFREGESICAWFVECVWLSAALAYRNRGSFLSGVL